MGEISTQQESINHYKWDTIGKLYVRFSIDVSGRNLVGRPRIRRSLVNFWLYVCDFIRPIRNGTNEIKEHCLLYQIRWILFLFSMKLNFYHFIVRPDAVAEMYYMYNVRLLERSVRTNPSLTHVYMYICTIYSILLTLWRLPILLQTHWIIDR